MSRVLSPHSLTVLVGRRLLPGKWQQLDDLLALVQQQQVPLLLLFPGTGEREREKREGTEAGTAGA